MMIGRSSRVSLILAGLGLSIGFGMWGSRGAATSSAAEALAPAVRIEYAPVEAFLKANCIECHGPDKQKGDVTLHTYHDAASVIKDREVWQTVLEKVRSGEMPPKKKARPDKALQEVFLRTIDQIFYQFDQTHPPDPGHVTIRRLNRTEYNNTIRDLVGVDNQPASDFPSDDVGQGFDNIGDVLSVSPILMERYITAADSIMQQALSLEPMPRVQHRVNARSIQPDFDESKIANNDNRPLVVGKSIYSKFSAPVEGDYVVRFNVYPTDLPDEGQPALAAILVDRKEVKTFEINIDATKRKPQGLEITVSLDAGDHRFELALRRGFRNDDSAIIKVRDFNLLGPPDARPKSEKILMECDPKASPRDQARQILSRFASRAYRRPATDDEVNHLVNFAEKIQANGQSWKAGIQLAMEGVLISPKFLFRVELDDRPDASGTHPIDEYQLASRLSYFIWSTMPDQELLDLAAKHQLTENLDSQVRRMLKDPRSSALVDNFAIQWLQLRRFKNFAPDAGMFPNFNERMRKDMMTETTMFIQSVITEDRSILDLVDADYTFLSQRLARFYGISDTNGNPSYKPPVAPKGDSIPFNGFVRVHLQDHVRGGVLTEASVLSVTSNPTRTSPVKRGKFVLEQILGMPPPPPPPNVPELAEVKTVDNGGTIKQSLRQRMEQHRADPTCANCHEHMDGIGFAFENFDAIGGYRSTEGGLDIDPSGTMPDNEAFRGVIDLKSMLRQRSDLFSRCLAKKMLIYATGRGVEYYDQRAVDKIVNALKENDYKFSTLVIEIVKSDPFRMRRGKEQTP